MAATRKPAPKKPPAKTPAKRTRKPRVRATGVPGPHPLVVRGFSYNPPKGEPGYSNALPDGAAWTPASPAANILIVINAGGTMALAARAAGLHEATPRSWNSRGQDLLGDCPTIDDYAKVAPDLESLALAAFHVSAEAAGADIVYRSLDAIGRAKDWRAAAHLLRVLPQAKEYRETTRAEITGANGGPIEFVDEATRTLLALADQFADEEAGKPAPKAKP